MLIKEQTQIHMVFEKSPGVRGSESRGVWESGSLGVDESGRVRESSEWSGVRESNPPSWLGKPEHYHYAKPARVTGRLYHAAQEELPTAEC